MTTVEELSAYVLGAAIGTLLWFAVVRPIKHRLDRWLGKVLRIDRKAP